jgi:DNA-binding NtrC family response regulator
VRELRNAIERAVIMAEEDTIEAIDLPPGITGSLASLSPTDAALAGLEYTEARARALEAFERSFLTAALERNDNNISQTARALGVHRQSLQKMLRRLSGGPASDV